MASAQSGLMSASRSNRSTGVQSSGWSRRRARRIPRAVTEAPEHSVFVQVTSVTTRRIGVDRETLELIREVSQMQRAYPQAHDPQVELAKQRKLLSNRLVLGEQREDLLSVAATFSDGEVLVPARRLPTTGRSVPVASWLRSANTAHEKV